ncbi:hypothetical protein [Candidatus Nanohalococcus occultus]|uniref:Uncharacterized protein n=1 Tax=Candidatus Nanohalococcus occultus TaxID=2978047 RepID=A0ABY8CE88_9ARCH|nr:hypothetical protein SVXNc_0515 [Candidatus Nanohaloarchaeota archaeon SVXNc]
MDRSHWLNEYQDVLRLLWNNGGSVSPLRTIEKELDRPDSSSAVIVKKLESEGIVRKEYCNAKVKRAVLTSYERKEDIDSSEEWLSEGQNSVSESSEDSSEIFEQAFEYEKKSMGSEEVLWLTNGDESYLAENFSDVGETGFAYIRETGGSSVPGVPGAELVETAETKELLEESYGIAER